MNTSQWGPRIPSLMFEKGRLNVLLVDHEPNVHASIVGMLEHYFRKGIIHHISDKLICSFHFIYICLKALIFFFLPKKLKNKILSSKRC